MELPYPPKELNPNVKKHWAVKAKHARQYKEVCWAIAMQHKPMKAFKVTFFPPDKRRRDRDNIISAFKAGQDGLAAAWGIDDSEFEITYAPLGKPVRNGKITIKQGE